MFFDFCNRRFDWSAYSDASGPTSMRFHSRRRLYRIQSENGQRPNACRRPDNERIVSMQMFWKRSDIDILSGRDQAHLHRVNFIELNVYYTLKGNESEIPERKISFQTFYTAFLRHINTSRKHVNLLFNGIHRIQQYCKFRCCRALNKGPTTQVVFLSLPSFRSSTLRSMAAGSYKPPLPSTTILDVILITIWKMCRSRERASERTQRQIWRCLTPTKTFSEHFANGKVQKERKRQ